MADWEKMYAVLCGAVDDVIKPLDSIEGTQPWVGVLRAALLEAEEIYCRTDGQKEDNSE